LFLYVFQLEGVFRRWTNLILGTVFHDTSGQVNNVVMSKYT
jgi:hypothetical protein